MHTSRDNSLTYSPDTLHVAADYSVVSSMVNLWFIREDSQIAGLAFTPFEPKDQVHPTVQLSQITAQHLMDQLWRCGLRPTEGKGSAGALAATEKHLNDMRAIVSKQLGVELTKCR